MPIRKENSARLTKESLPYDIFSREVVQSITNPIALAIWAYLQTKPESWVVRRSDILNHFQGLGRDRYDSAMKELKSLGLVWVSVTRDGQGQIQDRALVVESSPKVGFPTIRENPQVGKTTLRENPPLIDTETVRDTEIVKDTERRRFTRPTVDEVRDYCLQRGNTIDPQDFIDHYEANGWRRGNTPIKDWKACVRTWENKRRGRSEVTGFTPAEFG